LNKRAIQNEYNFRTGRQCSSKMVEEEQESE
jgi:hypothetical protein